MRAGLRLPDREIRLPARAPAQVVCGLLGMDDLEELAGLNVPRLRWRAFVLSALIAGIAGGLWGHFITSFSPKAFYLKETFVILGMLVIGGASTVSGGGLGAWGFGVFIFFGGFLGFFFCWGRGGGGGGGGVGGGGGGGRGRSPARGRRPPCPGRAHDLLI
jgi:hypothetical protein